MSAIRQFISRHMHAYDVKLSKEINEHIWARGGKSVPTKIKVTAKKEEGKVTVDLFKIKTESKKEEVKQEKIVEKK